MPDAPPEIVAAWVERIAKGALLGLWLLPFAFCHFLMALWGFIPRWLSIALITPVLYVIQIIIAWLLTSPDPGDARWSACLRWGARMGPLAWLIVDLILLVPVLGLKVTPEITTYLALAYSALRLMYLALGAAGFWYLSRLAWRVRDRALRINFSVLKWTLGVVAVAGFLMKVISWGRSLRGDIVELHKAWNWQPPAQTAASVCFWVVFLLVFGGYYVWLQWRLWRRLRAAAKSLRAAATRPTTENLLHQLHESH